MRTLYLAAIGLLAMSGASSPAWSREGMWLPDQAAAQGAAMRNDGLELPPERLRTLGTAPLGAVAALGSCTASFVSAQGLLLTNHHCLTGSVQVNSTADKDYWTNGFVAADLKSELPAAPGTRIHVIEDWRDVTAAMNHGLATLGASDRKAAQAKNRERLIGACEGQAGRQCRIHAYFGGTAYYMEQRLELQDIRLVYAPGEGLGNFGGDTDNWMWPRHAGDFGLYRAYVSPDGAPAPYAAANIPYRPKSVLTIARRGVKAGDFIFTAGFPVVTNRLRTATETAFNFVEYEPKWLSLLTRYESQVVAATAGDPVRQNRYGTILENIVNYRKKLTGSLAGADAAKVLMQKAAEEKALRNWIGADRDRRDRDMPLLKGLDALADENDRASLRELYRATLDRSQLLQGARTLYKWAKEREKPDADRAKAFRDRDRQLVWDRLVRIDSRYLPEVDRLLFEGAMVEYRKLPANERSAAFETRLAGIGFDRLYGASRLGDRRERLAWLDKPAATFEQSDDPFIQLAVALYPDDAAAEFQAKARGDRIEPGRDAYLAAYRAYKRATGEPVYPDADGSMRISWGKVEGRVRDGETWTPITTAAGLLEKQRGWGEFSAPAPVIAAMREGAFGAYTAPELGTLPVDFLSSADITNGNSGSPTFNARGELVGLVFDGTMDGVVSDWVYVGQRNRTVHVDIRFMLWAMDKTDGAKSLLRELGQ